MVHPGSVYGLVHEDAGRSAVDLIAALMARAKNRNSADQAVLRRLDWKTIGKAEAKAINQALEKKYGRTA